MGLGLSLATQGVVCTGGGVVVKVPIVVTEFVPDVKSSVLEPQINTTDKKPPEFTVLSVDPTPETGSTEAPVPGFQISPVSTPAPTAATKGDSKTPEVRIRTVEGLTPKIVKGDD